MIEYAMLIMIILSALLVMSGPIKRAFFGRWKTSGDSIAFGRQYDPKKTDSCVHYQGTAGTMDIWYDDRCFDAHRPQCLAAVGDLAIVACEEAIMMGTCKTVYCDDAKNY